MAFTQVPVIGTYEYDDGTPVAGTVTIQAARPITNDGVTFSEITVTLVNGQVPAGTTVPAFNDAGTVPFVDEGYKIIENLDGHEDHWYAYVRNTNTALYVGRTLKAAQSADEAVAAHEAKSDPHPVYLTQSEGDSRYATDAELANKADADHTHTISQVTDLQTALDAKADTGHLHALAISDISGLQSALDALDARITALEGGA